MRPDEQKLRAQHEEGKKNEQKDLENQRQPQSLANRDRSERGRDETGEGRVRSQDPNFGRGHH